jgi:HEAT repeat protein
MVAAVADAGRAVALDLRAQQKNTPALVGEVADADPRVRERALRTLTARGARVAGRAAAGRIHDPDPDVARAAVDALVAFRDPATVLTLIEAAQAGSVATTIRLIPVLKEIGGANVEGYLLTLEAGHGDRAVRQAASEALAKFRRPAPRPTAAKR